MGYATAYPASGVDLTNYGAIEERDMVRRVSWLVTGRVTGQELGMEWGAEGNDFVGSKENVRSWRRVESLCHSVDGKLLRDRSRSFASEEVIEG